MYAGAVSSAATPDRVPSRQHVRATAVFLGLARSHTQLLRSVASLMHLEDGGQASVVLFLNDDDKAWKQGQTNQMRAAAGLSGRSFQTAYVSWKSPCYRCMCDFMSWGIFDHPALNATDYILRMDSDGCLAGKLPDLWAKLQSRPEVAYVYNPLREGLNECGQTVEGLTSFAVSYARQHGLGLRERVSQLGDVCTLAYYTNFEVMRTAAFRESSVFSKWRDAVRSNGGIERHRWGDAPLRRISLNLMNAKVLSLSELAPAAVYCHKNSSHCPSPAGGGVRRAFPTRRPALATVKQLANDNDPGPWGASGAGQCAGREHFYGSPGYLAQLVPAADPRSCAAPEMQYQKIGRRSDRDVGKTKTTTWCYMCTFNGTKRCAT